MPTSINRVELLGYLGKDPELRYTQSGTAVANFSVATTERWEQDGEKKERTEWHRVVAWRKLAEVVGQYLTKGSRVFVAGALQTRQWEDKESGKKQYTTEIVARDIIFLDAKKNGGPEPEKAEPASDDYTKDDLPF